VKPPEEVAHELARDWLAKAATDLLVCGQLLDQGAVFSEAIAFHAQQATGKSLKALPVVRQAEFVPAETAITCVSPARKAHDEIARRLPEDIRH
jgi:HEPN domain-containing protein